MAYEISAGGGAGTNYDTDNVFSFEYNNQVSELKDSPNFNNKENYDGHSRRKRNAINYRVLHRCFCG